MTEGQGGTPPAGWYPDPEGNGERWWNGMSWGQLHEAPTAQPQQDRDRRPDQPSAGPGMRCVHCQSQDFGHADFVLTPGGGKYFDRGIGMATAQCLICRRCGFIHWFLGS